MTATAAEHPVILDPEALVDYLLAESPTYTVDELETMLARVGRNAGPYVVAELHLNGELDRRHAAVVVPDAWSGAEHPLRVLDQEMWRDLFTFAGYTHNRRRRARPRLPRTLYRGADDEHRDGWSWTDDRATAEWFANRVIHKAPGHVWRATVEPIRVFARITDDRGESEWVVDTDGLEITRA